MINFYQLHTHRLDRYDLYNVLITNLYIPLKMGYVFNESYTPIMKIIRTNPRTAYEWAKNVIGGRWPEAEPFIMTSPLCAYMYARDIIRGKWKEAEMYIMTDPYYAYQYAYYVIGGRWIEAEPYIKGSSWCAYYEGNFRVKL